MEELSYHMLTDQDMKGFSKEERDMVEVGGSLLTYSKTKDFSDKLNMTMINRKGIIRSFKNTKILTMNCLKLH